MLRRSFVPRAAPSGTLGANIFRSSVMQASRRFFCSSNPAIAAATISVLAFVGIPVNMVKSLGFREVIIALWETAVSCLLQSMLLTTLRPLRSPQPPPVGIVQLSLQITAPPALPLNLSEEL